MNTLEVARVSKEPERRAKQVKPTAREASAGTNERCGRAGPPQAKRAFELDLKQCPKCGGKYKIITAILEPPVIEKILTHLGFQARAPPAAPVRDQALKAA